MVKLTRFVSLTNFVVASSALCFQVFVLYPWHKELDHGFEELKKEHIKVLKTFGDRISEQQREGFTAKLQELDAERKRRQTWWRI